MRFSKADSRLGPTQYRLPLFSMAISAGHTQPADDYVEETLDLARFLVKRPESTFFVRVEGESMIDACIHPGDLLVVDRSLLPRHNDIVIAQIEGELTVKTLHKDPALKLVSRSQGDAVEIAEPFEVWGVVVWVLHQTRSILSLAIAVIAADL